MSHPLSHLAQSAQTLQADLPLHALLALGDIAHGRHPQPALSLDDEARVDFHLKSGSILAQGDRLVHLLGFRNDLLPHPVAPLWSDQLDHLPADQLVGNEAVHIGQLPVHIQDSSLLGDDDTLAGGIGQPPEPLFALLQGLTGGLDRLQILHARNPQRQDFRNLLDKADLGRAQRLLAAVQQGEDPARVRHVEHAANAHPVPFAESFVFRRPEVHRVRLQIRAIYRLARRPDPLQESVGLHPPVDLSALLNLERLEHRWLFVLETVYSQRAEVQSQLAQLFVQNLHQLVQIGRPLQLPHRPADVEQPFLQIRLPLQSIGATGDGLFQLVEDLQLADDHGHGIGQGARHLQMRLLVGRGDAAEKMERPDPSAIYHQRHGQVGAHPLCHQLPVEIESLFCDNVPTQQRFPVESHPVGRRSVFRHRRRAVHGLGGKRVSLQGIPAVEPEQAQAEPIAGNQPLHDPARAPHDLLDRRVFVEPVDDFQNGPVALPEHLEIGFQLGHPQTQPLYFILQLHRDPPLCSESNLLQLNSWKTRYHPL